MNRIKELPKTSSQLLSSTQIISSVHSVVKELVENSLDSFATNIEIKLDDFGLEKIEVKDNGKGIHKDDISFVAKPHCTSKITLHLDLNKIETYGFRGEALAALCSVSELAVTTKTAEENFGFTYTFDQNGEVLATKPCPCNQGTSITASNLFKNIPVRRQFYRSDKNKKEELKKVEDILVSFGCIKTGVRFMLFHNRNLIWQKPCVHKTREGLVHIFGNPVVDHMDNCEFKDDDTEINIEVFLPRQNAPLSCSQSSLSRSIIAINKRPVRMKIIDKLLKEYYNKTLHGVNKSRYPICYIAVEVPPSSIDVNFEPNKTAIAMENSNLIVEQLSKILSTFYSVDCTLQTDVPKNIPPISSESVLPTTAPSIQSNSTSNTSNALCNKSINSTFQTKLSDLAPNFKKSMSSKLSRKKDSETPSSKRRRTSSSFSTPPNDIHRHMNTLKSFFSADKGEKESTAFDLETSCDASEIAFLPVQENNVNAQKTPPREVSVLNNQFCAVTVHRAESSETPVINSQFNGVALQRTESSGTPVISNQFSGVALQRTESSETPVINNQFSGVALQRTESSETPVINNQFNGVALQRAGLSENTMINNQSSGVALQKTKSCETPGINSQFSNVALQRAESSETPVRINQFSAIQIDENSEISVKRKHFEFSANDKDIVMQNKVTNGLPKVPSSKIHGSDSQISVKSLNEINKSSEPPSSININGWSRGLHPVEKTVQPVTVLKPKAVGKQQDSNGTAIDIESIEGRRDSSEISPNQRKITPFDFFCRKHRLEVASLNPDFNNHQIAQILTEKWSRLSMEEKAIYKNMISKDYPKSIKNKDTLGKSASENLNKTKEKSTNLRKVVRKMKNKNRECSIVFSMELVKNPMPPKSGDELLDEHLNVMSCLTPGVWVCSQQHKLYLLNCFRLQETIVFQRLLETYQFEPEPLESPFLLTVHSLGNDGIHVLLQMNSETDYKNECIISDEVLSANGFKIKLFKGENESHFEVVGMTPNIAFYGVPDLKEILHIAQKEGLPVALKNCRPGKTILYLQGEAVRIARQYPASKKLEDIEDLLSNKELLSSNICIHSKPILHELYSIPTE